MMGKFNASSWALAHRPFITYLILLIAIGGALSFYKLGRNEDPPYAVEVMIVQAYWPGATVTDTINQVTDRLERKIQEVPNLDYVRSFTSAGKATVLVNIKSSAHRIIPDMWYQVRKKIGDLKWELPQGVNGPYFNDEFGDTFGVIYGFTSDGFSMRELRDYVDGVRSKLQLVPDVSKTILLGQQDERIYLEFSLSQLSGLGIDRTALIQALQTQNAVEPSGIVQGRDEKILVQTTGAFQSEQQLSEVNFAINGRMIRLADIATVKRGYADPIQQEFRVSGQPAIGIGIAMADGGDILTLGQNIKAAMDKIAADMPVGIDVHTVSDQPTIVKFAVNDFLEAVWEAVAIVLAVSFLSLGMRAGTVVALSIPLVLCMVFIGMEMTGTDLQRVSLGALIIALGLLVDDAMITTETMVSRLEQGDDKISAATFAYTTTAFPMLTGTLVTASGFVPIAFAQSGAGEFTFSLFAVVAIALISSWFVAILVAPVFGVMILPKTMKSSHGKERLTLRLFRRVLVAALRWKWITIALTVGLFVAALAGASIIPQQFFPPSDRPELLLDLKLPESASIDATARAATVVDEYLRKDPDIAHWSDYVGGGAPRFYLPLNPQFPNDFFSQIVLVAKGLKERDRLRARLMAELPDLLPDVVFQVQPLALGPPVTWKLVYRVSGPDIEKVRDLAYKVAEVAGAAPYVRNVNFDWIEAARTVRVRVNQDQARLLGLSSDYIAQILNTVISGYTFTQVRDSIYLVDVVARASAEERASVGSMRTLPIPLPDGRTVPLSQFATIESVLDYPVVWRRNRSPAVSVQAEIEGTTVDNVVNKLAPKIAEMNASLPDGYLIKNGGEAEDNAIAQASVTAVMPFMLFLVFTFLMIQLHSFQLLIMVLSVAPLGLIGVVAALLITHVPLGFIANLGIIALIGMITRNSVILIDQIRVEMAHGRKPWDAVVEATIHRFRPIILTSAAAILGLIPIAPTVFWGPLAYSIMGGLAGATALTLLFLPALYCAWFRIKEDRNAAQVPDASTSPA